MKNLVSHNQLDEWRHSEKTFDQLESNMYSVDEYYECVVECNDHDDSCKRYCRDMLM